MKINIMDHMHTLGLMAIAICVLTWGLDLANLVPPCLYCRTQRMAIGVLGLLMVLPNYRYVSLYFTVVVGLFGLHVSCTQIFKNIHEGQYVNMFIILAICALLIMVGQVLMLITRACPQR